MTSRAERLATLLASAERMAGGEVEHRATISAAHDEVDALAHALNVVVGELRYSSDQLARTREESAAKERLAAVGQLAEGVAHHIRNPLAVILNATAVISHSVSAERSKDVERSLAIIREEVKRANAIVTALLDYARRRPPVLERVALPEVVEGVLADANLPPNITVQRSFDTLVPIVDVDRAQLHEALTNLVANAVDAMPGGGNLVVDLAMVDSRIVIGVADDGSGDDETSDPHLLTARAIVEAHGGEVVVLLRDVGARFEIRLPA